MYSSRRLAPRDRCLTAEGENPGAARSGAILRELWGAIVLCSRAEVTTAVANLVLGRSEACRSEAGEEEGVVVKLHPKQNFG